MLSGIYLLRFSDDSFYIGQSNDIYRRYRTHCTRLKNGTHVNSKMLTVYSATSKLPTLHILCECQESDLDKYEIEAFEIFNPCLLGLNITPPAGEFPNLLGEDNGFAKYSNECIINLVHFLLRYKDKPLKVLAKEYGIHYSTVKNIANGTSHTWLKTVIPKEYNELLSMKGTRLVNTSISKGKSYIAISPDGIEYIVTNISAFAKEHNLNRGALGQVLNKKATHHKNWTLKQ